MALCPPRVAEGRPGQRKFYSAGIWRAGGLDAHGFGVYSLALAARTNSPGRWRNDFMQRTRIIFLTAVLAAALAIPSLVGFAQNASRSGPYKVLKTAKAGGEGGYDYIFADVKARRLYIPRGGQSGRLTVFNLDTLESVGTIPNVSAGGATVDPKSHHGFSTTKPVTMWDAKTLKVIKTIEIG